MTKIDLPRASAPIGNAGELTLGNSPKENNQYTINKISNGQSVTGLNPQPEERQENNALKQAIAKDQQFQKEGMPAHNYLSEYSRALADPKSGSRADALRSELKSQ